MYAVIFLVFVIYITTKIVKRTRGFDKVDIIIKETLKYSGINNSLYSEFLANINMAKEYIDHVDMSSKMLYRSIKTLENIGLEGVSGDTDFQEDITRLSLALAYEFEQILIDQAINNNVEFKPKYLNDRM
mgnify:CR=1 FL=1